jgi:hypothetical protein
VLRVSSDGFVIRVERPAGRSPRDCARAARAQRNRMAASRVADARVMR